MVAHLSLIGSSVADLGRLRADPQCWIVVYSSLTCRVVLDELRLNVPVSARWFSHESFPCFQGRHFPHFSFWIFGHSAVEPTLREEVWTLGFSIEVFLPFWSAFCSPLSFT